MLRTRRCAIYTGDDVAARDDEDDARCFTQMLTISALTLPRERYA